MFDLSMKTLKIIDFDSVKKFGSEQSSFTAAYRDPESIYRITTKAHHS